MRLQSKPRAVKAAVPAADAVTCRCFRLNHESLNHSLFFARLRFPFCLYRGAARAPAPLPIATGPRLQGFGIIRLICPSICLGLQLLVEATPGLGYKEKVSHICSLSNTYPALPACPSHTNQFRSLFAHSVTPTDGLWFHLISMLA